MITIHQFAGIAIGMFLSWLVMWCAPLWFTRGQRDKVNQYNDDVLVQMVRRNVLLEEQNRKIERMIQYYLSFYGIKYPGMIKAIDKEEDLTK